MLLTRPASASMAQHRQASVEAAHQRIDRLLAVPSFLGSKPYHHTSASVRKSSRSASIQVSSQASPYSLDPNMASLQYQPLNLPTSTVQSFDFLVLGSGIAGLTYALKVAEFGQVAVITKATVEEGCTTYAQGGVCAVLDPLDSVEKHVSDTMVAGAHLNNPGAVDAVCREGPKAVLDLVELGAQFTTNSDGSLHLTKEGGHSDRRIVHAADITGREIERALVQAAKSHPNITFFEHHLAQDLLHDQVNGASHCLGADVLDQETNTMTRFVAPVTLLATGGGGQVYPNTTNPSVTTGDGMAMAYRAKASMANMEFVQFHPTAFYSGAGPNSSGRTFLISEALRGEGGLLYNQSMERFMPQYDARLELAPRDIVARSIQDQMVKRGETHVLLDVSHESASKIMKHFPNIAAQCQQSGIDITQQPIPVVPAQHYMCGGVQTGLLGETNIAGLFACGEVACTGLHGANRLASNSLLEGLVFANRAVEASVCHAEYALKHAGSALHHAAMSADFVGSKAPAVLSQASSQWVAATRKELTTLMWANAGIVRNTSDMQKGLARLGSLCQEVKALAKTTGVNTALSELQNLATVGELIMASALQRKESRGLHYCVDFPFVAQNQCHPTVIKSSVRRRSDLSKVKASTNKMGVQSRPGFGAHSQVSAKDKSSRKSRELSRLRSQREE